MRNLANNEVVRDKLDDFLKTADNRRYVKLLKYLSDIRIEFMREAEDTTHNNAVLFEYEERKDLK